MTIEPAKYCFKRSFWKTLLYTFWFMYLLSNIYIDVPLLITFSGW